MLNREFMLSCFLALLVALRAAFWIRTDAALEVLALRQQVAVLKGKRPRPLLNVRRSAVLDHLAPLFGRVGPLSS